MYERLNHIGLCLSHKRTISYVNQLAADFTLPVQKLLLESPGVKFVGDNINIVISPHSQSAQVKVFNWFSWAALPLRICGDTLDDTTTVGQVADLPLSTWLLSRAECIYVRKTLVTVMSRILVKHLPALEALKGAVVDHIDHEFTRQMSKKSSSVLLGVIPHDENIKTEMVDILEEMHHLLPNGKTRYLYGGDQLTRERIGGVQRERQNSPTMELQLRRAEACFEEWHNLQTYLIVCKQFINLHLMSSRL